MRSSTGINKAKFEINNLFLTIISTFRASCVGRLRTRDMLKNLMRSLLQRKSRFFEDMDLVFSCMLRRLIGRTMFFTSEK